MTVIFRVIVVISCCLLLIPASAPSADIFRWMDEGGVIHFTDNPHNIPEKYKSSSVLIKSREASSRGLVPSSPDRASIPFQKKGQVVVIQATVNKKTSAKFVVDTGATYTMISQAIAKELGIDVDTKLPTIPFQTANGVINAPLINLDSIEVGGMQIKDLTTAVHDVFPDPAIAGLLGLNFLENFRMDIDTKSGVLHLERK